MKKDNEIVCYGLHIEPTNFEEMEYIGTSMKCNKSFVGINIDGGRSIALFTDVRDRNDCYNRIIDKYGINPPRAFIILKTAYVDKKYLRG